MRFAAFEKQMSRLDGLKFRPANLQTHWEALGSIEESILAAAITKGQPTFDEYPSPKMLKVLIDELRSRPDIAPEVDRSVEAPHRSIDIPQAGKVLSISREWNYYCDECSDSGWKTCWCGTDAKPKPWLFSGHCGRRKEHGSHEFVVPCPCAESNPDVQRRKARDQQVKR